MHYYDICPIGYNLPSTYTYQSPISYAPLSIVRIVLRGKVCLGLVLDGVQKPNFKCLEVIEDTCQCLMPHAYELAKFISTYYVCTLSQTLALFYGAPQGFSVLKQPVAPLKSPSLSPIQQSALDFCKQQGRALLFGDTGSGKTEIYIQAIIDVLHLGQSALLLMPEIALTPQMQKRLEGYFGQEVGIWHSKLTKKKRTALLYKIATGGIKVIAGARSSLFLPIAHLGLIVVDEEHDDAYKAMTMPLYQARDVAVYYAKILGIHVILGSATPALTSYHRFKHFRLKGGHFNSNASMREFRFTTATDCHHSSFLEPLRATLQAGQQAIVFVPTKANFQYLLCKNCQSVVQCPFCAISLSVYTKANKLTCHYCQFTKAIPVSCEECKTGALSSKKLGTAQVLQELSALLPQAKMAQFDRDEITTDAKLRKTLDAFNKQDIDVLVGTQMITKGHDYHNVALVVVLGIDAMLHMQDYRAREKALSAFVQIAGRTGRKNQGLVVVQTHNEDFFKAFLGAYEDFLEDELIFRQNLYPPFRRLARVNFKSKTPTKAMTLMQKMQSQLSNDDSIEVVGFGHAPIVKIANEYRYYIMLRSTSPKALLQALHQCNDHQSTIDIDPVSFT